MGRAMVGGWKGLVEEKTVSESQGLMPKSVRKGCNNTKLISAETD